MTTLAHELFCRLFPRLQPYGVVAIIQFCSRQRNEPIESYSVVVPPLSISRYSCTKFATKRILRSLWRSSKGTVSIVLKTNKPFKNWRIQPPAVQQSINELRVYFPPWISFLCIKKRIATRKALTTSKAQQRLIDIKTKGRQNAHNLLVVSALSTRKRHHPKLQNETKWNPPCTRCTEVWKCAHKSRKYATPWLRSERCSRACGSS
jgi:hypothetical protein